MASQKVVHIVTNEASILPLGVWRDHFFAHYGSISDHKTAVSRRCAMKVLWEYFEQLNIGKVDALGLEDLTIARAKDALEFGLIRRSPATMAQYLTIWRTFGDFVQQRTKGWASPFRAFRGPTPAEPIKKRWLTRDETTQFLLHIPRASDYRTTRNRAVVLILLATGLRVTELLNLTHAQISPEGDYFLGVRVKGRRYRNVHIPADFRSVLRQYLTSRAEALRQWAHKRHRPIPDERSLKLFLRIDSKVSPLRYRTVLNFVGEVCNRADIRRVTCHGTRHTFGRRLCEAIPTAQGIRIVAEKLGHTTLKHTMKYTEPEEDDSIAAVEAMVATVFPPGLVDGQTQSSEAPQGSTLPYPMVRREHRRLPLQRQRIRPVAHSNFGRAIRW